MKMTKNSVLFITLVAILCSFNSAQYEKVSRINSTNEQLLCHEWRLIKTTVKSEKTIFEDNGNSVYNFDCTSMTWTAKEESGELIARGTWILNNSELEIKELSSTENTIINTLTEKRLVIAYSDIIQEFTRK